MGKVSLIVSRWGRLGQVLEISNLLFVDETLSFKSQETFEINYTEFASYFVM